MDLIEALKCLEIDLANGLKQASSLNDMESLRINFLGRKGRLAQILSQLPEVQADLRPKVGQFANEVKERCNSLFNKQKETLSGKCKTNVVYDFDPTTPGRALWNGTLHPVTLIIDEVCTVFRKLGFDIVSGPEIELDKYNYEALNMPPEHPARDMHDTFYISQNILMRTHTSPVQIRTMLTKKPPLAVIAPGKVFRRDSDLTHTPMFHQIEGLMVGFNYNMAHLRGILLAFVRSIFSENTKIRFRPSFFPFTEPSAEVDISCFLCNGSGHIHNEPCRVCKSTGWVEILGCGMVDPAVYDSVGYDSSDLSGFAFGMGVERIAMLKYGINDLRIFFDNNMRFLDQFGH